MSNCYLILPKEGCTSEREQWFGTNNEDKVAIFVDSGGTNTLLTADNILENNKSITKPCLLIYSDTEYYPSDLDMEAARKDLKKALCAMVKGSVDNNTLRIFHHGGDVIEGGERGQKKVQKRFEDAGFVEAKFSVRSIRYYTEEGGFNWTSDINNVKEKINRKEKFQDIISSLDVAWEKASAMFGQDEPSSEVDGNLSKGVMFDIDSSLSVDVIPHLMALFVDLSGAIADPDKLTGEDFKCAFEAYISSDGELSGWIGDLSHIRSRIARITDAEQKKKLSDVVESGLLLLLSYKLFSEKFTEYHGLSKSESDKS